MLPQVVYLAEHTLEGTLPKRRDLKREPGARWVSVPLRGACRPARKNGIAATMYRQLGSLRLAHRRVEACA